VLHFCGTPDWQGATDANLLRQPSPKDLACWSDARQFAQAQRYVGLLLIMRERGAGPPELIPFLVEDSHSGYSDVCHRASVV